MSKVYFIILTLSSFFCTRAWGQFGQYPDPFDVQMTCYKQALKYYDLQMATVALYKMAALKPNREDLNDSLALIYFAGERYAQVNLVGQAILNAHPKRNDVLEMVAVSKQNLGMVKESLADYEKLYANDKSVFYLYQIATLQYQLKRYSECITSLDKVISEDAAETQKVKIKIKDGNQEVPMKAAAYNVKGICALELQQQETSIKYFKKALDIFPDFTLANNNLETAKTGGEVAPIDNDVKKQDLAAQTKFTAQGSEQGAAVKEPFVNAVEGNKKQNAVTEDLPFILIENKDLKFIDHNGNNDIDANENCKIAFTILNKGKGDGRNLVIKLSAKGNISGISFDPDISVPVIKAGESYKAEVYLFSNSNTENGSVTFNIQVDEPHGFGSDPVEIEVSTKSFVAPMVRVVDYSVTGTSGANLARKQPFDLQLLVQNTKSGIAENVSVDIQLPDNILLLSGEGSLNIGALKGGGTKELLYNIVVTDHYISNNIPITIKLKESYGIYSENKTISLNLNQSLATNKLTVQSTAVDKPMDDIKEASLRSDVDKNIPSNPGSNTNTYALIIGNENYSDFQSDISSEANVDFARNDAGIFSKYCEKTLGLPADNISLITDATAGKMQQAIDKMKTLIKNSDGKLQVIFYYAGHGLPDENTHEPYLMPVDVSGKDLTRAVKIAEVYNSLTAYPSKGVTVFLDACFSGGARNKPLLAARSVKIRPKEEALKGRITVFSASSGDQTSWPYKDKQHGMFTYFLLKKLQDSKGDVNYTELGNYLNQQVKFQSVKINSKEQEPQFIYSTDITAVELAKTKLKEGFK